MLESKVDGPFKQLPERKKIFATSSGIPVKQLYTPEDAKALDYAKDLGNPGEFPFTRGVYSSMYRSRIWTWRMIAGFGTPEDTNGRLKYLLAHGETGLSIDFDNPTLYGRDPDDPWSHGEVGKTGVSVPTITDADELFQDIDLGNVTTSMNITATAVVLLSMYAAVAENRGTPLSKIDGTVQTDILKEYTGQKEYVFPPEKSLRIIGDMFSFCARNLPKWHPISISGYHMAEAGATPVQELAFTLANGMAYAETGIRAGLKIDEFAPQFSFFFDVGHNFFEEIAKFRAARRMWARILRERFDAKDRRSMVLRFHTQTSGFTLTAHQPVNNITRSAIQTLAAVLGGTQSNHTTPMDEAYCTPTEKTILVALRSQQVIAEETGIADTVDPLGGSYFVEALTSEVEERAWDYINHIERMGKGSVYDGVIRGIYDGYFVREIAESAYKYQREVEEGLRIRVGVNKYQKEEEGQDFSLTVVPAEVETKQVQRVSEIRGKRDNNNVEHALERVRNAAETNDNLMARIFEAVKAYATMGEIMGNLREVFGEYKEMPII